MTVSSTTTKVSYSGNGSTTVFAYTFKVFDEDDLTVILRDNATGAETVQAINTNYSVSGVGNVNGGNITFVTAPASGVTVVVRRTSAQTQTTDYTPNDPFPAESHEEALDKLTFVQQEQQEEIDRSIKLSRTNTMTSTEFTLGPTARANKVLSFDANGEISVAQELGTFKGNWSAGVSYTARALVKDTSTNNIYLANAAHTSSGSQPLTTNVDSGKWELIVDAAAAATSATAAANSATAAANSASAASTSESNAATSASTASTQATNSANSATSSANSATAASNAQAAAEAALDTFDDRFLGAKASDPTLDNDGNALLDGALYFDTTNDIMKVYDLANTQWRQLTLTSANQAFVNTVAGEISPTNNIATVASSINSGAFSGATSFAETYFVSATAPSSPTLGDLWFDTTNDIMKVYSASGFVNAGSSVNGTANRYVYTATSGQTSFAATYDAGYVDVYLNGVKLQNGTDFTATDGANVVLTTGAALNDQIDIVGYGTFNIAIPDISGDLTPQLGGNLDTNGNDINFGDNDKAIFGAGSDLQIYHSGTNSFIYENGTGYLSLFGNGTDIRMQATGNENMLIANVNGSVDLYHDNSKKFETTSTGVDVTGSVTADGFIETPYISLGNTGNSYQTVTGSSDGNDLTYRAYQNHIFKNTTGASSSTDGTERMRIDASGNVGIGQPNPLAKLHVDDTNSAFYMGYGGNEDIYLQTTNGNVLFTNKGATTERMRIDSGGNLLVGKTSVGIGNVGFEFNPSGYMFATRSGGYTANFNRQTSDGDIVVFTKDGSTVGSIGVDNTDNLVIEGNSGHSGIQFGTNTLLPHKNGAPSDNLIDLGEFSYRFDDIFATNGTIVTSDANEKQQITALTDAEMTAAKAISALFKTFKWNSAVEAKGDAARTHTGVIAQDVQAAMTAAGLDAGNYAFFISSTWWETQTEVPAVEAVDAIYEDVVIPAALDDDGNEVEAERTEQRTVTEAVEAVAAYTRTDTYDTAEEAPEGATERTRMGIRYPELLAFIGAATEQRLSNIETRLATLETN